MAKIRPKIYPYIFSCFIFSGVGVPVHASFEIPPVVFKILEKEEELLKKGTYVSPFICKFQVSTQCKDTKKFIRLVLKNCSHPYGTCRKKFCEHNCVPDQQGVCPKGYLWRLCKAACALMTHISSKRAKLHTCLNRQ